MAETNKEEYYQNKYQTSLENGYAILNIERYGDLSQDDYRDLMEWLELILRQLKRHANETNEDFETFIRKEM